MSHWNGKTHGRGILSYPPVLSYSTLPPYSPSSTVFSTNGKDDDEKKKRMGRHESDDIIHEDDNVVNLSLN